MVELQLLAVSASIRFSNELAAQDAELQPQHVDTSHGNDELPIDDGYDDEQTEAAVKRLEFVDPTPLPDDELGVGGIQLALEQPLGHCGQLPRLRHGAEWLQSVRGDSVENAELVDSLSLKNFSRAHFVRKKVDNLEMCP